MCPPAPHWLRPALCNYRRRGVSGANSVGAQLREAVHQHLPEEVQAHVQAASPAHTATRQSGLDLAITKMAPHSSRVETDALGVVKVPAWDLWSV
jgi:hypothetical protein